MKALFRITGMTICASNLKLCGLLLYFSRLNTKRRSVVWEAEYEALREKSGLLRRETVSLEEAQKNKLNLF